MKIRNALFFLTVISGVAFSTSCSTTKGFGQDLQKVGGRLEDRAEATGGTATTYPSAPMTPAPAPGPGIY